jgi:hypothetical protein
MLVLHNVQGPLVALLCLLHIFVPTDKLQFNSPPLPFVLLPASIEILSFVSCNWSFASGFRTEHEPKGWSFFVQEFLALYFLQ